MKRIKVTFDEQLLRRLDATDEVKRHGRSEVVRRAVAAYLTRQRRLKIRERYREAYAEGEGLHAEFSGWEQQGGWPAK